MMNRPEVGSRYARQHARQLALWRWTEEHGWPSQTPGLLGEFAIVLGVSKRTVYRDPRVISLAIASYCRLMQENKIAGSKAGHGEHPPGEALETVSI